MSALVITSILALGFLGLFLLGRFGSNPNSKNNTDNDYWNNKVSMVRVVSDLNSYDLRQETMGLMYISPLIGNDRNINIQGSRQNNLMYYQDLNNQGNNTIFFRTFANTNNTFIIDPYQKSNSLIIDLDNQAMVNIYVNARPYLRVEDKTKIIIRGDLTNDLITNKIKVNLIHLQPKDYNTLGLLSKQVQYQRTPQLLELYDQFLQPLILNSQQVKDNISQGLQVIRLSHEDKQSYEVYLMSN